MSVYIWLGSAVAAVTLLSLVFAAGRAVGRMDEHLREQDAHLERQDAQIADLHRKVDGLGEGRGA